MIKNILNAMGKHMAFPINPWIISLMGFYSIVFAIYLYVPKKAAYGLKAFDFFNSGLREVLFLGALVIGVWLATAPLLAKTIKYFVLPLRIMALYWLCLSIIMGIADYTNQSIITYSFLSIFCLVSAANYSVNRDKEIYKNIFYKHD